MCDEVDECSAESGVMREQANGEVVSLVWLVVTVVASCLEVRQLHGSTQRSQVRAGCWRHRAKHSRSPIR